jgi:hypothetical protein
MVLSIAACTNGSKSPETVVSGTITLADSLGNDDFSGTNLTIITQDSSETKFDTLFHRQTDAAGNFSGKVQFPQKGYYTMVLNRDSVNLGNFGIILADNDTVDVKSQIPNIGESLTLTSREHEAMRTFSRVDRGFQRVGAIAQQGAISDSQLVSEIQKWSDFYWDVREKHPNTLAGDLGAERSVRLLSTWNPDEMLNKIDQALPDEYMVEVALNYGTPYLSTEKGFETASKYMDSLKTLASSQDLKNYIAQTKIQFYFDSSRVRQAKDLLDNYEQNYMKDSSSQKWARRIRYDLNYLAPGVQAPDFSFLTTDGDSVSRESLKGATYILEISPLANRQYQNDYDRTIIIHEIYKNYGLKIFTIPLDESELTVEGFFEERRKVWDIAKIGSFDVQDLIQKFNVVQVPTRLLIDKDGTLIRKYEADEFEDVIQGLNKAFRNQNSPS